MFVDPATYSFDHNLVDREPFIRLQEDAHIIAIEQVKRLNKQQNLARVKHGPVQCGELGKPRLELLKERQCVPTFATAVNPINEIQWERVLEVVPFEDPFREVRPIVAVRLYFEHLCMDARRYDMRDPGQPPIFRNIPHLHLGHVVFQVTRGVFAIKPAYLVDRRFYGPVKGTRALASAN